MAGPTALAGVYPVVAVPFQPDGAVDAASFRRLVRYMASSGVAGLMLGGIASEFYKLALEELRALIPPFVDAVHRAGLTAMVSVTAHATERAVVEARAAVDAGADVINVWPPFFLHPGREALAGHLAAVADAVSVPVIVQYAPREAGLELDPAWFAELRRQHPTIVAVKVETQPPGPYVARLKAVDPTVTALVGYGGINLLDAVERGADGVQPGSSFPELYAALWAHRTDAAGEALYQALLPYLALWMQQPEYLNAVDKWILFRRGIIASPAVRHPAYALDAVDHRRIARFLDQFGPQLLSPPDEGRHP
jgi:dihydrodipicolinate synthase/N-acetylneuraminate lyase